jgi:hypothetical protein
MGRANERELRDSLPFIFGFLDSLGWIASQRGSTIFDKSIIGPNEHWQGEVDQRGSWIACAFLTCGYIRPSWSPA